MKLAMVGLMVMLISCAGCATSKPSNPAAPSAGSSVVAEIQSSVSAMVSSNLTAAQSAEAASESDSLDRNPSPDTAKSWLTKWCQAQPGMTRAEMREIMGPPQQEFDLASGTPQMTWTAYEFMFNAFMNSDDVVRQLDVNDFQLTDAQRAQIKCDFIRTLS